jgi:hypothetical protein
MIWNVLGFVVSLWISFLIGFAVFGLVFMVGGFLMWMQTHNIFFLIMAIFGLFIVSKM